MGGNPEGAAIMTCCAWSMNAIPFWFSMILNAGVLERVWK